LAFEEAHNYLYASFKSQSMLCCILFPLRQTASDSAEPAWNAIDFTGDSILCLILRREKNMAEKKAATAKKAIARRTTAKKAVAKGDSYVCGVCGLAVTVDEVCGCVDVCDIICCGKPMKPKKVKVKAAKR
jgi:hypothetical protein